MDRSPGETLVKPTRENTLSNSILTQDVSVNHTLDELHDKANDDDSEFAVEQPKQRQDGRWECWHKCKNKQTLVDRATTGEVMLTM